MATITSLGFVITSSYDGGGMRRARRDIDGMGSSTKSLNSILAPFNSKLKIMSELALGLGPALIPAAAAVGALAGGMAAASVAAGAAAGIFGGALAGALKSVSEQIKGPTAALDRQKATLAGMTPGTKAYREQLKKVAEAQKNLNLTIAGMSDPARKYIKAEQEMKGAWGDFIQATEKDTLTPVSIAMGAVSRNMSKFVPIVKAVSPLVTRLARDFARWMDGPGLDTFIDLVLKYGVPALSDFIDMGKSVVAVLGRGFRDFLPLGTKVVKALAEGAKKLQGWAQGGGFERFIQKVTDSAPELKSIFKDLVTILGAVSGSMAETSDESLTVVGILTDLVTALSPEIITAITYAWLGWTLAVQAWALATTLAAGATATLTAAQIAWATVTGPFALLLAGAALTVLAVVAALVALGVGIYFLVKHWDTVWGAIKATWDFVWGGIKTAAAAVWNFLTHGWGQFLVLLMGPIGILIFMALHWKQIWEGIQVAAQVVWVALQIGWAAFTAWLSSAWGTVWSALQTAWSAFAGWMTSAWNTVWGGLRTAFLAVVQPIVNMWNTVWPQMQLSAHNIWAGLTLAWQTLWNSVLFAWNAFWGLFGSSFTGGWNTLLAIVTGIWSVFYTTFSASFSAAWTALTSTATALWALLTAAWNLLWTVIVAAYRIGWAVLSAAWQVGWAYLTGIAQVAWAILTGAWQVVWAIVTSIWNVYYATFSAIFSGAWNVIVAIATGIWNVIKAAWQALWAVVTAIFLVFTAIFTGNWGMAWNAIKDAAAAIWNVMRVAWQALLNVLVTIFAAFVGVFTAAFRAAWAAIQAIATAVWNLLRTTFQAFLAALQNLWSVAWAAIRNVLQTVLNAIVAIAQATWNLIRAAVQVFIAVVTGYWNVGWTTIRTFFQAATAAIITAAGALWEKVRELFSTGSTWLRTTFWDPVSRFFTKTIPDAFDAGARALGKAWDGIKALVRKPIQAVVDVVYNNGIVKLWNAVAGVFGADRLGEFKLPAFKEGGPTGSGSADGFPALVHPGEHVWTKDEVRGAGGHGAVAALRSQAMGGAKVRTMGDGDHAFKDGGGVFGSGWGPDTGPDLVPDGIIGNIGGAIGSAVGKLKDLALGAISGPFGAAVDAMVKGAQAVIRKLVPGNGTGIEELAVAIPKKIGDVAKSWVSDNDVAEDGGGGFVPWAKWKDGDGTKQTYRGVVVNRRTAAMLHHAEKIANTAFTAFQGSYSNSVGASAGTHSGGGAVDLGPAKDAIVGAMRESGFAAWRRTPAEGFSPHIHGIAVGDPTASSAAKQQVKAFQAGKNGLADNGPDTYKGGGATSGKSVSAAQATGKSLNAARGWSKYWSDLKALWTRESGWRWNADNPSSSAYGIPQALPGSKMKSSGADWKTNPATQIKWGLGYIKGRYGNPGKANSFQKANHWYAGGTYSAFPGWGVVGDGGGPELMRMRGGERIEPLSELVGNGGGSGDINVNVSIPISGRADHGVVDRLERETVPRLTMAIKQGVGRRT